MSPNATRESEHKVVCASHGVVASAADHTAAGLVEEEHAEDCTAETAIVHPDRWDGFAGAARLHGLEPDELLREQPQAALEAVRHEARP